MGVGDWIMASVDAREAFKANCKKCVFRREETNETFWHEIFEGNPHIEKNPKTGMTLNVLPNYPGRRPYFIGQRFGVVKWNDEFKAVPGDIYLTPEELATITLKGPYIVVEPNVKKEYGYSVNKDWGFDRWQTLIDRNKTLPWIQPIYPGARKLQGIRKFETATFRIACALLKRSMFFVGTDGGLHHASAALGVPAIVIWGGFTSPKHLGYDSHINIHDGGEPCGNAKFCGHCRRTMKAITVERVEEQILSLYSRMSKDAMLSSEPLPKVQEAVAAG